jgi:hypothetical protein
VHTPGVISVPFLSDEPLEHPAAGADYDTRQSPSNVSEDFLNFCSGGPSLGPEVPQSDSEFRKTSENIVEA